MTTSKQTGNGKQIGWARAFALAASRVGPGRIRCQPTHVICWWNRGGFTIPYCLQAAGLKKDCECCMGGLTEIPT